ncbi:uncharacterized protein LOC130010329 [Patella vulgata]|uniref:uncharacterized protein LOC130010329 n=1 Tax=Patella vulgata TaxID=6465 RepID=UPI0021800398|nr:uncharacterized protein LOC130010329 [Patella vulgata]
MDDKNVLINTFDLICIFLNFILYKLKKFILNRNKKVVFICLIAPYIMIISNATVSVLGHVFADFTIKLNASILHREPDTTIIYDRRPHPLTNGTVAPYFLENQTRYVGEDARFDCEQIIWGLNTSKPHINQVIWHKDGKFLNPDERHSISWTFRTTGQSQILPDLQSFKVKSTLKITMIDESDFGIYNCHVSERTHTILPKKTNKTKAPTQQKLQRQQRKCTCNNSPTEKEKDLSQEEIESLFYLWNKFVWNSEFRLIKDMPRVETVFVAPGTVFSVGAYFRHLGNNEDFTLYYTVNGKEPVVQESRCSIFVLLYNALSRGRIFDTFRLLAYPPRLLESGVRSGEISRKTTFSRLQHCVTPKSYGIYDMVILRKVFNERDKTYDIHEFNHPLKIDVKPKESDLFVFADDSGTDTTEDTTNDFDVDCWNMGTVSQSLSCRLIKRLVNQIARDLHFRDVAYFIFTVLFLFFYIYVLYKSGMYLVNCIMIFSWPDIPIRMLAGIPNKYEVDIKYHVFISYCDNDEQRAHNLTDALEEEGLKVFLRSRDISPGRPRLSDTGKAICQSAVVFVIASVEYVDNCDLIELEINMILQKTKKKTLFVIKVDDCGVANIFRDQYRTIDLKDDSINGWAKQMATWLNNMNHASRVNNKFKTGCLLYLTVILYSSYHLVKNILRSTCLAHKYCN